MKYRMIFGKENLGEMEWIRKNEENIENVRKGMVI